MPLPTALVHEGLPQSRYLEHCWSRDVTHSRSRCSTTARRLWPDTLVVAVPPAGPQPLQRVHSLLAHLRSTFSQMPSNQEGPELGPPAGGLTATRSPSLKG